MGVTKLKITMVTVTCIQSKEVLITFGILHRQASSNGRKYLSASITVVPALGKRERKGGGG